MTPTNIKLPYLEDTGLYGKKLYTPKEWTTERFRHYTKRIYNVDIKQILTDDMVPTGDPWDTKEPEIRHDFIWVAGPSAIEIITKAEFNTDPGTIETDKLIAIPGILHAQKKHLPQPRRFPVGKTKRQRNTRRTSEDTNNLRKTVILKT